MFSLDLVLEELASTPFCITNDLICFQDMMSDALLPPHTRLYFFGMVCLNCQTAKPRAKLSWDFLANLKREVNRALHVLSSKANMAWFETHDLMPCWARKTAYPGHGFPA